LIADKGGDEQITMATRILAGAIAIDASWFMAFNSAIDPVIQNLVRLLRVPDRFGTVVVGKGTGDAR
jgi:hypothetical protein